MSNAKPYMILIWDDSKAVYETWDTPFFNTIEEIRSEIPKVFAHFLNELSRGCEVSELDPTDLTEEFYESYISVVDMRPKSQIMDADLSGVVEAFFS